MLCDRCNKNEATFHKSVYINGKGYETNLCRDCANLVNLEDDLLMDTDFGFDVDIKRKFRNLERNFLSDFWEDDMFVPPLIVERNLKKCSKCNSTFNDFLRNGKLGCENCYDEFEEEIRDMLENMDNPTDLNLEFDSEISKLEPSEFEKLNEEFNKAVMEERYEDAGEIKKKLNELRDKDNKKENN